MKVKPQIMKMKGRRIMVKPVQLGDVLKRRESLFITFVNLSVLHVRLPLFYYDNRLGKGIYIL